MGLILLVNESLAILLSELLARNEFSAAASVFQKASNEMAGNEEADYQGERQKAVEADLSL